MTLTAFVRQHIDRLDAPAADFIAFAKAETTDPTEFLVDRLNWTSLARLIGFAETVALRGQIEAAYAAAEPPDAVHLRLILEMMAGSGVSFADDQTRGVIDQLTPSVFTAEQAAALKELGRPLRYVAAGMAPFSEGELLAARDAVRKQQSIEASLERSRRAFHNANVAISAGGSWEDASSAFAGAE
jgi:hypothetical protein